MFGCLELATTQAGKLEGGLAAIQAGKLEGGLAAIQTGGVWVSSIWISRAPTIATYSRRRLTGLVWSRGLGSTQLYLVVSGLVAV